MDGMMGTDERLTATRGMGGPGGLAASPEHAKLREVCQEFEGLMLSQVLKQGLLSPIEEDEGAEPGGDVFMEFAIEQMAREMGRSEATGLAASLYQQLTGELGGHGRRNAND